jgi:ribosomal protein L7/L12
MTKNQLISKLTEILKIGANENSNFINGFNSGVIEAIKLANKLPDTELPGLSENDRIRKAINKYLSYSTDDKTQSNIIEGLKTKNILFAIKAYKDYTGIDLRTAKNEFDSIRAEINI